MLEEYMRKARLENPGDGKFIGLHEKYFNLFKDPISFEDDGNGNNVGDDDDGNGDDGDDDANDGDGNVDENDANECDKNPNGSNQSFGFNKISLDDFGNDSGPTESEPVDPTKQGTVVDVNTAEEGENTVENCGIMSSPEEFTQWLNKNVNLVGEACDSIGDLFGDNSAAREALNEVVTPQIQPTQKRVVKPSSYVLSPYMNKKTNVVPKITKMEFIVGNSLFAMQGDKLFTLNLMRFTLNLMRFTLKSHEIQSESHTESMLDGTFTSFDEKWKRFFDQVNAQFNGNEGGRGLEAIDLSESHEIQNESHEIHSESYEIYSESHKIQSESHEIRKDLMRLIFESHLYGHPRHATVARVKHTIPKLKWKTKENFYDCGIFTMLHMENFNGGPASDFDCGLPVESQLQLDILRRLRFKFATKILLHEINLQSEKMVEFAKEFDKKGPSEKISIIIDAIKNKEEHDRIEN
ncbi:ulp1 protease family, C-terminal catalytic domain-containing protein [Tanacetum coccineum]